MTINKSHILNWSEQEIGSSGFDLTLVGDTVFFQEFRNNFVDNEIKNLIQTSELALANLEAPLNCGQPKSAPGPVLSTEKYTGQALSAVGFDVVSLANNHAMDYGSHGLRETIQMCQNSDMSVIGAGMDEESGITPLETHINDTKVAIFGASQREYGISQANKPGTTWIGNPNLRKAIQKYKEKEFVTIVFAHGGIEYIPLPPLSWQNRLQALVDWGSDLVISHHPHVTQGLEIYNGSPIFYSIGNFLFKKSGQKGRDRGMMVHFNLNKSGIKNYKITLTKIKDEGVVVDCSNTLKSHYQYLCDSSELLKKQPEEDGYWQETAGRLYKRNYMENINRIGRSRFCGLFQDPIFELDNITRGVLTKKSREERQLKQIFLYLQGESHKEVIRTGMGLQSGMILDNRTEQKRDDLKELFLWTGFLDEENWREKTIRRGKTLINRLL